MNKITFLSDFGTEHSYTGVVKGVILSINSAALIIDITHSVNAYQIEEASYLVATYYHYFPAKTVHLAVIDPGVGGRRQPLILETAKYTFVGPDNGLFSKIYSRETCRCYRISEEKLFKKQSIITAISHTFHARDIFAPAAALLSLGVLPNQIGDVLGEKPVLLVNRMDMERDTVKARIISIDPFGNIITSFRREDLRCTKKKSIVSVKINDISIQDLRDTYSDTNKGELMFLWGSSGHLEVAVNQGNAASVLKCRRGQENIEIKLK